MTKEEAKVKMAKLRAKMRTKAKESWTGSRTQRMVVEAAAHQAVMSSGLPDDYGIEEMLVDSVAAGFSDDPALSGAAMARLSLYAARHEAEGLAEPVSDEEAS